MDSESTPSLSSTPKDEFEGLEVAEFDANVLWELLHDEPMEDEAAGGGAPEQAMEGVGSNSDKGVEGYWCLNDFNNINNNNTIQEIDWFGIMEETSACSDMGGWYGESCMEEMNQILEIGNYSITQSEILSDEIGYIGLWRE